jgi:hypothetical protein
MPDLPALPTNWPQVFFVVESRLSPRLERLVRTDAFLDTLAVANGVGRLTKRSASNVGNGIVEALGLPSSRQVRLLQRSVDRLNSGRSEQ